MFPVSREIFRSDEALHSVRIATKIYPTPTLLLLFIYPVNVVVALLLFLLIFPMTATTREL